MQFIVLSKYLRFFAAIDRSSAQNNIGAVMIKIYMNSFPNEVSSSLFISKPSWKEWFMKQINQKIYYGL